MDSSCSLSCFSARSAKCSHWLTASPISASALRALACRCRSNPPSRVHWFFLLRFFPTFSEWLRVASQSTCNPTRHCSSTFSLLQPPSPHLPSKLAQLLVTVSPVALKVCSQTNQNFHLKASPTCRRCVKMRTTREGILKQLFSTGIRNHGDETGLIIFLRTECLFLSGYTMIKPTVVNVVIHSYVVASNI